MHSTNIITDSSTYQSSYECEYLVIGTGPAGSVAGQMLSKAGKDVIFVEEGPYVAVDHGSQKIGATTQQLYRYGGVFPFLGKPTIAFTEGCCVGGGSTINGGLIWRTPQWILDDWQQNYSLKGYGQKQLASHFDNIEHALNVHDDILSQKLDNLDSMALLSGAKSLKWKSVMARRAMKKCQNINLCPIGCPSQAKQSMGNTYLPLALNQGARIMTGLRVVRIEHKRPKALRVIAQTSDHKKVIFNFKELILAAGAIQTPYLLRRSHCSNLAGEKLEFHLNLKIAAKFPQAIHAQKGTMFTVQVQEFLKEGMVFMASNMQPAYLALTLAHLDNIKLRKIFEEYPHYGIYVAMVKPKSQAKIISSLGQHPLVVYRFEHSDLKLITQALRRLAQMLFAADAQELYLPLRPSNAATNMEEVEGILKNLKPDMIEAISVHAMASCSMGHVTDCDGRLNGYENIFITDASVLPSNIGESPQGTIMAFASEIISRHLKI